MRWCGIFLLGFFFLAPALAAFESNGFELVYTAPVETSLQASDLRAPAEVWAEMISAAKKSLVFGQMYAISKEGEPLEQVLEALEKAGARGVKTRFMVEQKMLRASSDQTLDRLKKVKGLELRVFEFGKLVPDALVHAKYFVVDGKTAYLGSQNFDWRSLKHVHEVGVRITDKKIAGQLGAIFEQDWKAAGAIAAGKKPALGKRPSVFAPKEPAYLVASPPTMLPAGVVPSETELVHLIGGAQGEVRITLLDYYPLYRDKKTYYAVIDTALRTAAARGVKVKLLVSHWNLGKPAVDHLKSLSLVPNVELKIATIPEAKEGKIPFARVLHSKTMVIDDKIAWIGTSNWSGGYFDKVRGVELVLNDEKMAKRVAALHEQLWGSSYSVKIDPAKDYPAPNKGGDK